MPEQLSERLEPLARYMADTLGLGERDRLAAIRCAKCGKWDAWVVSDETEEQQMYWRRGWKWAHRAWYHRRCLGE